MSPLFLSKSRLCFKKYFMKPNQPNQFNFPVGNLNTPNNSTQTTNPTSNQNNFNFLSGNLNTPNNSTQTTNPTSNQFPFQPQTTPNSKLPRTNSNNSSKPNSNIKDSLPTLNIPGNSNSTQGTPFNFNLNQNNSSSKPAAADNKSSNLTLQSGTQNPGTGTFSGFSMQNSGSLFSTQSNVDTTTIPDELNNKTIKEILELFEKDMEEQIQQFQIKASKVKRRDRSIYDCLELLLHLGDQIQNIENAQKELIDSAKAIKQEQEKFLEKLSEEVKNRKKSEADTGQKNSNKTDQRSQLYQMAGVLGGEFKKMSEQLKSIKEKTDSMHSYANKTDSKIEKIKKIANCHLNSMRWIDQQADAIEDRLNSLQAQLQSI